MKTILFFATFGLLSSVLPASAQAETVVESASGQKFETERTVDGKSYVLTGTGIRKKFIIKVYAMALYVDEADAKRAFPSVVQRAGGADKAHLLASDHAESFLVWGQFGKTAVLRFVRGVDKGKIQNAYRESLSEELSDKSPADLRSAAEQFVALFDHDMQDGQDLIIHTTTDGKVSVEMAGVKKDGPQNAKLNRAIWSIWLGAKPISADLKKGLVDRIEVLGK